MPNIQDSIRSRYMWSVWQQRQRLRRVYKESSYCHMYRRSSSCFVFDCSGIFIECEIWNRKWRHSLFTLNSEEAEKEFVPDTHTHARIKQGVKKETTACLNIFWFVYFGFSCFSIGAVLAFWGFICSCAD